MSNLEDFLVLQQLLLHLCTILSLYLHVMHLLINLHKVRATSSQISRERRLIRRGRGNDYLNDTINVGDITLREQLRMNRDTYDVLCQLLRTHGVHDSKHVTVEEQLSFFLHILAGHHKNRLIKHTYRRSGETVSKYFNNVLKGVLRLQGVLLKKAEPITEACTDYRWKYFQNCLGALDGTYIRVRVPPKEHPKYRSRKGEIATNVLGVCTPDMMFTFVLPGWEGSAADGRVLRNGYVAELEKNMLKILPNTDLRERPHIESKIKTWKKLWGCIYGALSTSGIAWSESEKMLNIEDEDVWTSYCKKDPDIVKLRNKPLTWYEDWQQFFGKDRATGEHAEAPGDVVEELDKEEAEGASTGDSNAIDRRNKKLKRQDVLLETVEKMHDSLNSLINTTAQHLGLMTQRIGYDQDLAKSRRDVYGIIDNIGTFTNEEKIMAATKIVSNPADVDLFLSLPIEMKKQYVTMKLAGQI